MQNKSCDIIIPVWNQTELTRDCLESIATSTEGDHRIIVIDNASDADTRGYLLSLKQDKRFKIEILRNESNAGFIKAVNRGISVSSAPYVCILNNDTIVTKGWLSEMIAVADQAKDIGIVNPSSNNLGQRPSNGQTMEEYASGLTGLRGKFVELGAAIGFCMLIKREVISKVGLFDEVYGMGNFEDTDFSRSAVREGFRCVRACGAYVYHRENTSFKLLKDFDRDFKRNREIFEFRWGKPERIAYILDGSGRIPKDMEAAAARSARAGNWVYFLSKGGLDGLPEHSNISQVKIGDDSYHLKVLYRILTKKKKFNELFVSEGKFGRIIRYLSFIHKAKVTTY